jgi:hypothetical protein
MSTKLLFSAKVNGSFSCLGFLSESCQIEKLAIKSGSDKYITSSFIEDVVQKNGKKYSKKGRGKNTALLDTIFYFEAFRSTAIKLYGGFIS